MLSDPRARVAMCAIGMRCDEVLSRAATYVNWSTTDLGLRMEKLSSMYAVDTVLCNQVVESQKGVSSKYY